MRSDSKTLLTTINTLRRLLAPTMVTSMRGRQNACDRSYRLDTNDRNPVGIVIPRGASNGKDLLINYLGSTREDYGSGPGQHTETVITGTTIPVGI